MYANRETIELINRLKALWGAERFSQTNSRLNGNFINHVRLYQSAEDKQKKRNYLTISTNIGITLKIAELTK